VLGLAYQSRGNYEAARHSYESSIGALQPESGMTLELASAIDNLGSLYFELHDLSSSRTLRSKARNLYEADENDAGIARVSSGLALIALVEERRKEARKNLEEAFCRIKMLAVPDQDTLASGVPDLLCRWKS
jgi:tetratricopeptide (TPR) repeat protein